MCLKKLGLFAGLAFVLSACGVIGESSRQLQSDDKTAATISDGIGTENPNGKIPQLSEQTESPEAPTQVANKQSDPDKEALGSLPSDSGEVTKIEGDLLAISEDSYADERLKAEVKGSGKCEDGSTWEASFEVDSQGNYIRQCIRIEHHPDNPFRPYSRQTVGPWYSNPNECEKIVCN